MTWYHRRMCRTWLVIGVIAGTAACASREPQPPPAPGDAPPAEAALQDAQATAAAEIAARLEAYQEMDSQLHAAEGDSQFVAYFEIGDLRYVVERITFYPTRSAINEYYFQNGRLFYYIGQQRSAPVEADAVEAIETRLSFDPDGALMRADRSTNGVATQVPDDDVLAVRMRVAWLTLAIDEARRRQAHQQ